VSVPLITLLGRMTLVFLEAIGAVTAFAIQAIRCGLQPPWYRKQIVHQMMEIGYYSLPVVGLTAIFTGMVLALQSYTGFARFSAESAIPNVVVVSLTRELGPVLAALMVAGRVGAAGHRVEDLPRAGVAGAGEVARRLERDAEARDVDRRILARAGRIDGGIDQREPVLLDDLAARRAGAQRIGVGVERDRAAVRADRRIRVRAVTEEEGGRDRLPERLHDADGAVDGERARTR
jgi:hypothetical protein